jgi:hypothetical protein
MYCWKKNKNYKLDLKNKIESYKNFDKKKKLKVERPNRNTL